MRGDQNKRPDDPDLVSIHQKVKKALHTEELREHAGLFIHQAGRAAGGAAISISSSVKDTVLVPVTHVVGVLPFGMAIIDPDLGKKK